MKTLPENSTPSDEKEKRLLAGWATTYVFEKPFARVDQYQSLEVLADEERAGVYGLCGGDFHTPV